jgi:hypothetical protein
MDPVANLAKITEMGASCSENERGAPILAIMVTDGQGKGRGPR